VLDGNATVNQAAVPLASALANVQCGWFDGGGAALGPLSTQSVALQLSLVGITNAVNLQAKGRATLAAGGTANLRCRFGGVALALGGFQASAWSWDATRTA
jgi:hypothetical protein